MKHLILILTLLFSSLALFGQYDMLYDSTFGIDGIATLPYSITAEKGIFLQTDGKLVLLAEKRINFDSSVFSVMRLASNGTLDLTYNGSGINNEATLFHAQHRSSVALLLPGNDLLVAAAGKTTPWFSNSVVLHKYREDGIIDPLFGNAGALILTEDSLYSFCKDLKIYEDSSILILYGGSRFTGDTIIDKSVICKINADGKIDSSFAVNGKLELTFSQFTSAERIVLSEDGSIYILANYNANFNYYYVVVKLNPDFSIDPGFQFQEDSDYDIFSIGVDEDAKLTIAGSKFFSGFKLWRFMPNGLLDNSFSKDGMFDENLHTNIGSIVHQLVQPDGQMLFTFTGRAAAMRVNPNGTLDYSFDLDGTAQLSSADDDSWGASGSSGLVLQPDGKIVFLKENKDKIIKVLRVRTRP